VDWLVLWLVLVFVTVTVTVTAFVEVLVVLRARAGMAIAMPTRTTAAVNAIRRDRPPPTRERLTSLALRTAFIARLP
jgi:DNA-binding cell septation regulator SpoVG